MIVYNVGRRFFSMKENAETYRKQIGLRPEATIKIDISHRDQLAALLDGLCYPPKNGAPEEFPAPASIIDDAYVSSDVDVPAFVRESMEKIWKGQCP